MNLDSVNPLDLPFVRLCDRQYLPAAPGIYFVITRKEVIYVGQSKNILIRWLGHHNHDLIVPHIKPVVAWLQVDKEFLDQYESFFIDKFKPLLNCDRAVGNRTKSRYEVINTLPRTWCYRVPQAYNYAKRRYGTDWALRVVLAGERVTRIRLRAELLDRFSMKVGDVKLRRWCQSDSIPDDVDMAIVDAIVSIVKCHPESLINVKKLKARSAHVAA